MPRLVKGETKPEKKQQEPKTACEWMAVFAVNLMRDAGTTEIEAARKEIDGKVAAAELRGRAATARMIAKKLEVVAEEYKKRGK